MKMLSILTVLLLPILAHAHCQVPCGVYTDEMRFGMIEEDLQTIEKAMKDMKNKVLSGNFGSALDKVKNIDQDKIKEKIKKELYENKDKVKDKLKKLLNKN